jgi:ribosomal protein S18 acetylase RimI-like enzyme
MSVAGVTVSTVEATDSQKCNQCNDIEKACFSTSERLNITQELTRKGVYAFSVLGTFGLDQHDNVCMGYVLFQKSSLAVSVSKIVVLPSCRRQGIGKLLLRSVENYASNSGIAVCTLNVEENNMPAISMYTGEQYVQTGYRLDFYDIGRNAIQMEKQIL